MYVPVIGTLISEPRLFLYCNGEFVNVHRFFRPGRIGPSPTLAAMADPAPPIGIVVGAPRTAMSSATRERLGLDHWPDGTIGFRSRRDALECLAANGGTSASLAAQPTQNGNPTWSRRRRAGHTGQLDWSVTEAPLTLNGSRSGAQYAAGGPFLDTDDGLSLVIYHGEIHDKGDHTDYWSFLGMWARQGDSPPVDLGPIVSPGIVRNDPVLQGHSVEMGGGGFVIRNGFVYVYFGDVRMQFGVVGLGVARASLPDIIARARRGQAARFWKLCDGEFSSPALGGDADDLLDGRYRPILWFDAAWWPDASEYVLVYTTTTATDPDSGRLLWSMYLSTSPDARSWREPQALIERSERELIYVSVRSDPRTRSVEGDLDVWWLSSAESDFDRWSDATLMRMSVASATDG